MNPIQGPLIFLLVCIILLYLYLIGSAFLSEMIYGNPFWTDTGHNTDLYYFFEDLFGKNEEK